MYIPPKYRFTIVNDEILFEGRIVARFEPGLWPTLLDRLTETILDAYEDGYREGHREGEAKTFRERHEQYTSEPL